jgi:hypothetical protein
MHIRDALHYDVHHEVIGAIWTRDIEIASLSTIVWPIGGLIARLEVAGTWLD